MTAAQYSIGVSSNRFELFDLGDEDPLELIKKQELEREARKKAKLTEKDVKTKAAPQIKGKTDKKINKEENVNHKGKEDSKTARDDQRKGGTGEFKSQRNNYRGQEDREKDNYRNREDQEKGSGGRDREGGGGDKFQSEDGGFRRGGNSSEFPTRGRGGARGASGGGGPGFRGRTFQRGGGGRSYPEFRGKREFERQSGSTRTGVKPTEKREGGGNYNWGATKDDWATTNEDELNNSNDKENWDTNNERNASNGGDQWTGPSDNSQWNPSETGTTDAKEPTTEAVAPTAEPGTEGETAPADSETPKEELTLDEWKARKAPKVAPSYNLRKPGEGEDLTQWKKMYALRKKKEEEDDDDEEYEYIDYPQRVGRQKHVLDIDIRYKDSRGSNNARGRGRGRGGAGGSAPFRGGNQERPPVNPNREAPRVRDPSNSVKEAPKVDDEHDFPSLN